MLVQCAEGLCRRDWRQQKLPSKQGNLCFLVACGDLVLQGVLYGEFAFVLAVGESG